MQTNEIKESVCHLAYRGKSADYWRTLYENEKPTRDTSREDDLEFVQNHRQWIDSQFEETTEDRYIERDRDL
jgi:hypothetical protein